MKDKFAGSVSSSNDFVAKWDDRLEEFQDSTEVTSNDKYLVNLELDIILEHIDNDESVFDIGCGNGATIARLIKMGMRPKKIGGCDLSHKMIGMAKENLASEHFMQLDLNNDDYAAIENFKPTTIIHKRVLHNLGGRANQREHLCRLSEALPVGSKILLISAFVDGLIKLNVLRHVLSLEPATESKINDYSRLVDVKHALEMSGMKIVKDVDFSSTYAIGSRVLQPYLYPDVEPYLTHPINEYFSKLPNIEGFGLHQFIVAVKE